MSVFDNNRDRNRNSNSLAGLTLDAVLRPESRINANPTTSQMNRTLIDIIKEEERHGSLFGHKDKKSWKAFRDRLRLKRAGAAWTSSIHIPTSDIPIHNKNNNNPNPKFIISRRNSVRFTTPSPGDSNYNQPNELIDNNLMVNTGKPQMNRHSSSRFSSYGPTCQDSDEDNDFSPNAHAVSDVPPPQGFRPQISRHNSTRMQTEAEGYGGDGPREGRRMRVVFADERTLSAREAVADQEAAEAEAAAQAAAEREEGEEDDEEEEEGSGGGPVKMSLMDLLEETDRKMGVVGSRYAIDDEEDDVAEEDDDVEDDDAGGDGVEHTCCVCMVRHKGAAFIPCGHTFCRLCSREQGVQRGNCPLCNGFILEILDIF